MSAGGGNYHRCRSDYWEVKHEQGPVGPGYPGAAPSRLRTPALAALARAAAVPVGACLLALLGLTAYTAAGAAGAPPARISVTGARVLVPSNPDATAAFFVIRNTGRSPDTLVSVSSPQLRSAVLSQTVVADGAGHMEQAPAVVVPAGGTVSLIPGGVDVMVPDPPALRAGQQITLDLRFAASGTVRVRATVVRPGS